MGKESDNILTSIEMKEFLNSFLQALDEYIDSDNVYCNEVSDFVRKVTVADSKYDNAIITICPDGDIRAKFEKSHFNASMTEVFEDADVDAFANFCADCMYQGNLYTSFRLAQNLCRIYGEGVSDVKITFLENGNFSIKLFNDYHIVVSDSGSDYITLCDSSLILKGLNCSTYGMQALVDEFKGYLEGSSTEDDSLSDEELAQFLACLLDEIKKINSNVIISHKSGKTSAFIELKDGIENRRVLVEVDSEGDLIINCPNYDLCMSGLFVDSDVNAFAEFCVSYLTNGSMYRLYEISRGICKRLREDVNNVKIGFLDGNSLDFIITNKYHIVSSDDKNMLYNVDTLLHRFKLSYETGTAYMIKSLYEIVDEDINPKQVDVIASDGIFNDDISESDSSQSDDIFKGLRIVALKYDGKTVGFRFKGDSIEGYDVSKEVAKKYGVSNLKIATCINLTNHNGLLLSKSEINSGRVIKDISDDKEFVDKLFNCILSNNTKMTEEKMRSIIKNNVDFKSLEKNVGIFEFYNVEDDKSLGVSYEDNDEESNVYIYNIFLGDEYINISNRGTVNNPVPDEVIKELVEEWNRF